jgi:predicted transcriptional regulator
MNENNEENIHFRMRLDEEVEEAVIPTQVDELRIEKLSQRMTLISILIPVLIVVILAVAYLDIKRRVIRTEDSGAVTAQHLSQDVESRFSSLSLKQAHLEEGLAKLQDETNRSLARTQVSLQKLEESLKQARGAMVSQKELKTQTQKIDHDLADAARSVEELKGQVDGLAQSLQARMSQSDQQVADQGVLLAQLKQNLADIDQNKIDKPAMDLALKLEALKIKQLMNSQSDDIQSRLRAIEKSMAKLSSRKSGQVPPTAQPKPAPPEPALPAPEPAAPAPGPTQLQEQTIGK